MDYSFNADIAKVYGVDCAVFIHNLYWWIAKNEANGRHYYDGRNWTYNSMEAFTKLFPFWSRRQIERIINKLKNDGAIYVGNYNTAKFDRTQWYALHETVTSIYANGDTHFTEPLHPFHQTVKPIPDSKPDINTDSKPDMVGGKFSPPSLDDVKSYCLERNNRVDPERFIDFYTSNGWMVGKNKMKDWKAAVRTWEAKDGRNTGGDEPKRKKYGTVV